MVAMTLRMTIFHCIKYRGTRFHCVGEVRRGISLLLGGGGGGSCILGNRSHLYIWIGGKLLFG